MIWGTCCFDLHLGLHYNRVRLRHSEFINIDQRWAAPCKNTPKGLFVGQSWLSAYLGFGSVPVICLPSEYYLECGDLRQFLHLQFLWKLRHLRNLGQFRKNRKRLFVRFRKYGFLAEIQAKMSGDSRILLFSHHNYQVSLILVPYFKAGFKVIGLS